MNRQECDILCTLAQTGFANQRLLSQQCGHSLGIVNRSLKQLKLEGYLHENAQPTAAGREWIRSHSPKNAVILAAGFCMRMVPINGDLSKAFLEVNGEPLIERLIRQLQEAGIRDITVVVGFLKERFEYLMDAYGVKLVVNTRFAAKNNLHSMKLVRHRLGNTYILPCDIWCRENPFRSLEPYSWYLVSDTLTEESDLRVNRNRELVPVGSGEAGNAMIGICYLTEADAGAVAERIGRYSADRSYDQAFWEAALYHKKHFCVPAKVVSAADVVEINTYEQLRELDKHSNQLKSRVLHTIAEALSGTTEEIREITVLKKGMTNRSFLFSFRDKKYIMRIPGEGTDRLINRRQEAAVYRAIADYRLCDNIVYMDPVTGYKITEFFPSARTCDPSREGDLVRCMEKLRSFHRLGLKVDHEFDIFGQIDFYEGLRGPVPSVYRDYEKTKERVLSLKPYMEAHCGGKVLTHIDAVPDNFLFVTGENGEEEIRLIDWEYAGMQDPHVDIAMFCIYSGYSREQADRLMDAYFPEGCPEAIRTKIYCYISACGLLWSNWCEYKRLLGVEFGEYSIAQYRYAKDYYRLAKERMGEEG